MVKYTVLFIIKLAESTDQTSDDSSPPTIDEIPTRAERSSPELFRFNVKNRAKQYIHVRYTDFTHRANDIYIVCAGKVAKIFIDQGSTLLKIMDLSENQNWLVFAVAHKENVPNYETAMKYYNSRASFSFTYNNAHFPPKIKMEKLSMIYMGKIPLQDLYTNCGRVIPRTRQCVELQEISADGKIKKPDHQSLHSLIPDHQQVCEAYDTIITLTKKNDKAVKRNNQSVGKLETADTIITLDGKSLFYDEQFFKATPNNQSTECYSIAVAVDAGSFYSEIMNKYFVPLVLRIPRICFLPVNDFQDLKIKHLYLESESKANLLFTTEIKIPIPANKRDVHINYKNLFFVDLQNVAAVAAFLLSESVVFKLTCDAVEKTPKEVATLFGTHATDATVGIRKPFVAHRKYTKLWPGSHNSSNSTQKQLKNVIGRVKFNLSDLVHRSQYVKIARAFTAKNDSNERTEQEKSHDQYVFENHKLLDSGMRIEISVKLGQRLNVGLDWNHGIFLENRMNRAVIVCHRSHIGELLKFYKELVEYNARIYSSESDESDTSGKTKTYGLFSGYVVDCVEYTIIFVEGLHNSLRYCLGGHFIQHEPIILYDRMMIFDEVLYSTFYQIGGFYHVSISRPLETLLSNSAFYVDKNIPQNARKGLLKLDLTRKCKRMREFCDSYLAVEPDELQSLDIEFGIPMQRIIN